MRITEVPVERCYPRNVKLPTKISPIRGNLLIFKTLFLAVFKQFEPKYNEIRGLIGATGFVGGQLQSQTEFSHFYNSKNMNSIENTKFDLLICAGARAEKWKANQFPIEDEIHIQSLCQILSTVQAKTAILISTVDVYDDLTNANENSVIAFDRNHTYGRNRFALENFWKNHFTNYLIIRLPALFGSGLKKNIVYDFLNDNEIEKIDSRHKFQFYNIENLWHDIERALALNIKEINMTSEPILAREVAKVLVNDEFNSEVAEKVISYDLKSIHAHHWNGTNGYLYSKSQVLNELKKFGESYKRELK